MSEIFIKIEGITGESKDAKHKGWIDALNVEYGLSQGSSMNVGGGGGVGKAGFRALTFTHFYDRASPAIFKYCAVGKHIPLVNISVCKSGGGQQESLRLTLKDAIITDVSPRGSQGSLWTESVSMSYSVIEMEAFEQTASGSMRQGVRVAWNVKENCEC
jgi:type VI secretion system secreted protein Hcp